MNQGARDHEAALHAARQTQRDIIATIPETQCAQVFFHALFAKFAAQPIVTGLMGHRVTDRLPKIQVDLLGHDSDTGFGRFEFLIDVMAEDFHLAAGFVDQ